MSTAIKRKHFSVLNVLPRKAENCESQKHATHSSCLTADWGTQARAALGAHPVRTSADRSEKEPNTSSCTGVALDGSKRPKERFHPEGRGRAAAGGFLHDCPCSRSASCHQSRLRHREAPLFHAHACTETCAEGEEKSLGYQIQKSHQKPRPLVRVTAVFFQISKRHALCTVARVSLTFTSIFIYQLALATSRL